MQKYTIILCIYKISDKWSEGFRQIVGLLPPRLAVGRGCHAIFGAEIPGKGVGAGEAAGLTDLLDSEPGLVVHQTDGIVKA